MTLTDPDAIIIGAIVEGVFYGVYVVLFILYLVLRRRNNHTVGGLLTPAQILLFGLCTLFFCLDVSGDFFAVVPDVVNYSVDNKINAATASTYSIIDFLAQMILLYRCWIIWDKRWVVVAVPGFLALASLGIGLVVVGLFDSILQRPDNETFFTHVVQAGTAAYFISLGVNALTTLLIVTKILLISREVRPVLGSAGSHQSFRITVATLIESGLLIFVSQLIYAVLFLFLGTGLPGFCLVEGPITQIYGIAPTLLGIRVIMGSSYDKTTMTVSSSEFADLLPSPSTQTTMQPQSTTRASTLNSTTDNKRASENVV